MGGRATATMFSCMLNPQKTLQPPSAGEALTMDFRVICLILRLISAWLACFFKRFLLGMLDIFWHDFACARLFLRA